MTYSKHYTYTKSWINHHTYLPTCYQIVQLLEKTKKEPLNGPFKIIATL